MTAPAAAPGSPGPLTALVEAACRRHPDAVATVFGRRRTRYGELLDAARGLASTLVDLRVSPGGQVALLLANLPQTVVAFLGVLLSGSAVVPLSPLLREGELRAVLSRTRLTGIIALDGLLRAQPWLADEAGVVVITGVEDALVPPASWAARLRRPRIPRGAAVVSFRDAIRGRDRGLPRVGAGDPALLAMTGGTTGVPKLAQLSHGNLAANVRQTLAWFGELAPGPGSALVAALPYFHVYGVTTAMNLCLVTGATQLLVPRFRPREVLRVIARHRPRYFPAVPRMLAVLADAVPPSSKALGCLEVCISGADTLSAETARDFEERTGRPVVEGYGLTEASPVTHCRPPDGGGVFGSVGRVYPDTEARIVDTAGGAPVEAGEVGELLVRGPQVMKGYLGEPEETLRALDADGWLHTGDLARADEAGRFYLAGRKKDMMIVKGFKVYPGEVEAVLRLHPAVADAAVVGVADPVRGEAVRAFVVGRPGRELVLDELVRLCHERLARYKVPTGVEVVPAIPRSAVGKVLRDQLRREVERRG